MPSSGGASSSPPAAVARGRWLVLGAAAFWGTSATLARVIFRDHHVPALQVVELRLTIASALLAAWLLLRDRSRFRIATGDVPYFLILGVFGTAAIQGSYYYSIATLGVGLAILIQYLAPALIAGWDLLRGRPLRPRAGVALALATAGTGLLVWDVDAAAIHATRLAWTVCFASAAVFAFYILYSKRGLRRYAPETMLFYTFSIAALAWALVIPPSRIAAAGYGPRLWLMFAALGVFSTLVPFLLFNAGLRHLPAAQAGILATLEPVVAVLTAALVLHEGLRPVQWLGALLVLAASALATSDSPETVAAQPERG